MRLAAGVQGCGNLQCVALDHRSCSTLGRLLLGWVTVCIAAFHPSEEINQVPVWLQGLDGVRFSI